MTDLLATLARLDDIDRREYESRREANSELQRLLELVVMAARGEIIEQVKHAN